LVSFSIGVHIVENEKDWIKAKSELQPDKLKSIFPENVLNTSNFIIEEFIQEKNMQSIIIMTIMEMLFC
jgi:biotin carboxylase